MNTTIKLLDFVTIQPPILDANPTLVAGTLELAKDLYDHGSDYGALTALFYAWQLSLSKYAPQPARDWMTAEIAPAGVCLNEKKAFEPLARHALQLIHRRDKAALGRYAACLRGFYDKFGKGDPVQFQKDIWVIREIMVGECQRVFGWN
ncbi:hypothetical protein [Devosia sp.]|uniref:hypothetical protein n=1 Tax=Devosia sp. TaxID=1871048 RepID=UPI003BAC73B1